MSKFRGQILGVLTTLVVASFIASHAQNAGSNAPFRDNPQWSAADGVWSTTRAPASPEEYLMTRGGALAPGFDGFRSLHVLRVWLGGAGCGHAEGV